MLLQERVRLRVRVVDEFQGRQTWEVGHEPVVWSGCNLMAVLARPQGSKWTRKEAVVLPSHGT